MRLSPKSIFIGLVAVGLPFAVTVGWTLGGPAPAADHSAAAPHGSGSFGGPARDGDAKPGPASGQVRHEAKPGTAAAAATAVAPAVKLPASGPARPLVPLNSVPPLTDPPIPTPTVITSAPPSPSPTTSASPSVSTSAEPSSGGLGAGLLRRR